MILLSEPRKHGSFRRLPAILRRDGVHESSLTKLYDPQPPVKARVEAGTGRTQRVIRWNFPYTAKSKHSPLRLIYEAVDCLGLYQPFSIVTKL